MKKISILIFIGLFSVITQSITFAQLTFWNDLYVYYPFNNNALDYSGNEIHATGFNVTPAVGVFGDSAGAYSYNGIDSKVTRPFLNLGDSCTLAGWFYSEADSQSTGLIYNGHTGQNGYGIFVKKPFGNFGNGFLGKTLVIVQGGVNQSYFNNQFELPKNQWLHIALVRRGQMLEIYIDGVFQTMANIVANPPQGDFSVGSSTEHINEGYPSFRGRIDELMVFRSAISAQNVLKVYQSNVTDNKPIVNNLNGIKILNNPINNGLLSIVSERTDLQTINIVDVQGKVCLEKDLGQNEKHTNINISSLNPGLYTALIKTNSNTSSIRFIKK
jgi:hypothetical protein